MNMTEIRTIAKERGVNSAKLRKVELIRTIQAEEHNETCFATEYVKECGQMECLWRADCEKSAA